MGDEKEGPYKVVAKLRRGGSVETYSIAMEHKNGYLKEVVPDAGEGQFARHICNLLNKQHKMLTDNAKAFEEFGETDDNSTRETDGSGDSGPDLGDGGA